MKRPGMRYTAPLLFTVMMAAAPPASALDPFSLEIEVGNAPTLRLGFSSVEDMIDQLDPERLQRRYQGTAADPRSDTIFITLNFRGLTGVELNFPQRAGQIILDPQGSELVFRIQSLGINEVIDDKTTRVEALRELLERLKTNKGLLKKLLTALTLRSPIDGLAGNPESLFSRRQKGDMDHGFTHKVSQVWGCGTSAFNWTNDAPIQVAVAGGVSDIFADAQARAAELHAQNEMALGVLYSNTTAKVSGGDFKSTGIILPLSYTAKFDFNPSHKLRFDLPLAYTDTEGAETASVGFGVAYTYPVSDVWTLTPAAGMAATGSVDLISAGGVQSMSLTSAYTWRLDDYALSMGNSIGQYESIDLKIGDVEAGADVKNLVITNGFMLTGPNRLIAKNLVVEYSFTNTRIGGDDVYTDQYNEAGVAVGYVDTDMGVIDSHLKFGLSYLLGDGRDGDVSALKLNLMYRY